jgi:hypothetical protein
LVDFVGAPAYHEEVRGWKSIISITAIVVLHPPDLVLFLYHKPLTSKPPFCVVYFT